MNPRTKNLALAGGISALLGVIGVNLLVGPAPPSPANAPATEVPESKMPSVAVQEIPPAVASSPSAGDLIAVDDVARGEYAVTLQELRGLSPDTPAGTVFELWVTWEPPVTEEPRLQRLIGEARLERLIPGPVPEAPVTALLSVPKDRVGDLIYADTFGALNVVLPG